MIDHQKLKNNTSVQIFTKRGPLAFLPISNSKTSLVYSVTDKLDINEEFKQKQSLNDVTKNKYKKQISDIKNDKIKNSLLELSKVYKKK